MNGNIYLPQTNYLKSIIRTIWQVDEFTAFSTETIIPKGVVEIIFNFSETEVIQAGLNGREINLTRCFINGFNTNPVKLQLPRRHVFFGIQFQPVAIKKLFAVPAKECSNHIIDMTLIDKMYAVLWHKLAEKLSFKERVNVISDWLESKRVEIFPQEKLLNYFIGNPNAEILSVPELADNLCYSSRHLSRKIYDLTEMNTEEVLHYKKYLHSVHLLHTTKYSLTEISYLSRFSDQSHFIKSFKAYSQMTPGEYNKIKSPLPGHIYSNVR